MKLFRLFGTDNTMQKILIEKSLNLVLVFLFRNLINMTWTEMKILPRGITTTQ